MLVLCFFLGHKIGWVGGGIWEELEEESVRGMERRGKKQRKREGGL